MAKPKIRKAMQSAHTWTQDRRLGFHSVTYKLELWPTIMLNELQTQTIISKINRFKVDELKVLLHRLGMSKTGRKADLQLKVTNALQVDFEKIKEAVEAVYNTRYNKTSSS
jgi:hypothetical protein